MSFQPVQTAEIKKFRLQLKNCLEKCKKISWEKTAFSFNISWCWNIDIADAKMIDYNKDTNISDVSSNKSAQITAKK